MSEDREIIIVSLLPIIFKLIGIITNYQCFLALLLIFAAYKRSEIWIIVQTLPRDLSFMWSLIIVLITNRSFWRQNSTPASLLSARAAATPEKVCFIFNNKSWTFKQVNEYSWRVAHVFQRQGLTRGDVVALMSTNRPEFVASWLGLSRLGVVTALINTNLKHDALRHSLKVACPKAVIVSAGLCQNVRDVRDVLDDSCQLLRLCGKDQIDQELNPEPDFSSLDQIVREAPAGPIKDLKPPNYKDRVLYIYTSGTTGFPKAAVLLNSRYLFATSIAKLIGLTPNDRIYNPLPLYHLAGGVVGIGPAFLIGASVVIRDKFSASAYFKECAQYNCTVGQYIGEMCRYVLAVPPSDSDRAHSVKIMLGNGLRPAIWENFIQRFGVGKVVELYGSSEGNTNIVNIDGTIGAVGFLPNLLPLRFLPIGLIKVNENTGELIRSGPNNLCVRCKPGEPGMFVGKIVEGDATKEFHGYLDKSASKKKVAENVFSIGDKAFLSGDILVMDEKGYFYFKDRTGDTFRWKGENVATVEVEAAISNAVGLRDACVYGVEIPGTEGRAGMATILDPEHNLDLDRLAKALNRALPTYAQPLFLRVAEKMDMTSTFKLKKVELQKEGFDVEKVKDKIYFYVSREEKYQELTKDVFENIMSGRLRV